MKRVVVFTLCLMVLVTPCVYDSTSSEPAPLAVALPLFGQALR